MGFPSGKVVQNPTAIQEPRTRSLNWEDPLEKEIAIHSRVIAWNIPGTKQNGCLEDLQIGVKRREAKSNGEKEGYKHLNAEF